MTIKVSACSLHTLTAASMGPVEPQCRNDCINIFIFYVYTAILTTMLIKYSSVGTVIPFILQMCCLKTDLFFEDSSLRELIAIYFVIMCIS